MKQLIFLMILTLAGAFGALSCPFWGILLYYTLAVLRPEHLWAWALPGDLRWSLMAAMIVFLSIGLNFHRVIQNLRPNIVMLWVGIFTFWLGLSIINAYYPVYAMKWGMEYLKIFAILFIAMAVINKWWQIEALTVMILVTLGYVAWEVNALYFFQGRMDIFHYGLGGLDNNGAGLMLAMGIPFAYVYGVRSTRPWQRAIAWCLGAFMLHAMLMSYSRGAMVATLVAVVWLLIHHRPRYKAVMIALVAFMLVSVLAGQQIRDRFFSTDDYKTDGSAQLRFESWTAAWKIATDNPMTGQGVRNSAFFSQNYGADRQGRTIHSQYLQTAADSGIPAMVSYIILLIVTFWGLHKTRRRCLMVLGDLPPPMARSPRQQRANHVMAVAMGVESSLLIFVIGGIFLSLEMFELPWILIAISGVLPALALDYMGEASDVSVDHTAPKHEPIKLIPNIPVPRSSPRATPGLASLQGVIQS